MADVLLVGPEEVFPREMEDCARAHGHHPIRAHGAGQVLIESEKPGKHLVFLDSDSRQYEALTLLQKIRERQEDACVILTAGEPSVELAVSSIKEGAWDFLIRPVEEDKLALIMDQTLTPVCEVGRPVTESMEDEHPWTIITKDPEFKRILSIADLAASGQAAVFIQGESGTGKEMIARFIHSRSNRKNKPFVAVNCAALPESLLESELFGHEKGAFTGAIARRIGRFEMANGGTILLDEISEMQMHLQAKLLRVLQEQTVDRVGGSTPVQVDVRVIATTNRKLSEYIKEGNFREDLYYRLNVIPLHIPPLRERKGDILPLTDHFVNKHNKRNNKKINRISENVYEVLCGLHWGGNVRELENMIERAVVMAPNNELRVEHLLLEELPHSFSKRPDSYENIGPSEKGLYSYVGLTVQEMERRLIVSTLDYLSDNRTRAAEMLGISVRTLRNKLKEYKGRHATPI